MTVVTPAVTSAAESPLYDLVSTYLSEALHGPECSGKADTVTLDGVQIDLAASAGWGLRFTRTLPGGRTRFVHLAGDDLTIERAAAAVGELLRS